MAKLNNDIGEVKMSTLTEAMDFMRCIFGKPGCHGCVVCCYLCSSCTSCPRFDYHWCLVQNKKNRWACCKCGAPYSPSDSMAFLFGMQIGPNPETDMQWWVSKPPKATEQDLMNLLKCINSLRSGALLPEKFKLPAPMGVSQRSQTPSEK